LWTVAKNILRAGWEGVRVTDVVWRNDITVMGCVYIQDDRAGYDVWPERFVAPRAPRERGPDDGARVVQRKRPRTGGVKRVLPGREIDDVELIADSDIEDHGSHSDDSMVLQNPPPNRARRALT
jgi:hypothetical protein